MTTLLQSPIKWSILASVAYERNYLPLSINSKGQKDKAGKPWSRRKQHYKNFHTYFLSSFALTTNPIIILNYACIATCDIKNRLRITFAEIGNVKIVY